MVGPTNQQVRVIDPDGGDEPTTADLTVGFDPVLAPAARSAAFATANSVDGDTTDDAHLLAEESAALFEGTYVSPQRFPDSVYTPPAGDDVTLTMRPFYSRPADSLSLFVDDHGPGIIKGTVELEAGIEAAEATVEAVEQDTLEVYRTTTDAHGEYRIEVPEGGTFHVMTRTTVDGTVQATDSRPNVSVPATGETQA